MKTSRLCTLVLSVAGAGLVPPAAAADLSLPGKLSGSGKETLRKAMQSQDYMESLGKQHGLTSGEMHTLMPAPGVIRPNAAVGASSGLVSAKSDLMKDLVMSNLRRVVTQRVIDPPGFNPSDVPVNRGALGSVPPSIDEMESEEMRRDYWVSRCRPILPLDKAYDQVVPMFVRAPTPGATGMPASLAEGVANGWNSLSNLRKAVVRLEPLAQGEYATGIYLGDGKVLTAKHVFMLMTPQTKAVWPGLLGSPSSAINHTNSQVDVMDLAVVFVNAPPASAVSAMQYLQRQGLGILDKDQPIAVLSCPQEYGKITGDNFRRLYGELRIARASPGIIRETAAPNSTFVRHDCATMQGTSGGPVVSLPSGHVIGIHVGGDDVSLNQFIPLSASSLFHESLP